MFLVDGINVTWSHRVTLNFINLLADDLKPFLDSNQFLEIIVLELQNLLVFLKVDLLLLFDVLNLLCFLLQHMNCLLLFLLQLPASKKEKMKKEKKIILLQIEDIDIIDKQLEAPELKRSRIKCAGHQVAEPLALPPSAQSELPYSIVSFWSRFF